MKYLSLIFITILINITAFSQCNIKILDADEANIIWSSTERIYRNEDLENGLQSLYANFYFFSDKVDKNMVKVWLQVIYIHSRSQPVIVPRSVIFNLSNGDVITVSAFDSKQEYKNGTTVETVNCKLSVTEMNQIKSVSLNSFSIKDNRTAKKLSTYPFEGLFQNQLNCIMKEIEEL